MTQQLVRGAPAGPLAEFADRLPPMIAGADDRTAWRFVDFFAVTIRNPNTREAYYRAVSRFMGWCEQRGLHRLDAIRPIHVAAYIEQLPLSRPSVRQHLSAISRCFDWMVSGGTLDTNPATSVQRPRHVVRVGRTPVLSDDQARTLLESISIDKVAGLRDRALIATMLYTFGRVGAVIAMDVEDYRLSNHQRTFLLHEKGGKEHHVPAHHRLVEYLGEYMDATGLWDRPKEPLFQSVDITKSRLKGTRMNRQIVFQMVRRRARRAGLPPSINCHSFRATGITKYLSNRGALEDARAIAAHESSQTTRLSTPAPPEPLPHFSASANQLPAEHWRHIRTTNPVE